MRGRCEDVPVGIFSRAQGTGFKVWIFLQFHEILKGWAYPKEIQNSDFSAVSCNFEGTGLPKKLPKLGLFRSFLGIFKAQAYP
jgi:hypothetical protein